MHLAFGGEKAVHIIWKNTTQTVKFRDGNIMFWGCFLAYDTGKRHIIEKRMDLQMYQNILDTSDAIYEDDENKNQGGHFSRIMIQNIMAWKFWIGFKEKKILKESI